MRKAYPIIFEGITYPSQYALAKAFNVSQTLIGKYKNNPIKLGNYLHKRGNYKRENNVVGKIFGSYKIVECIGKTKRGYNKYRCVCTKCGHERITNLSLLKQHLKCSKCHRAEIAKAKFEKIKNTYIGDYKILDYQYEKCIYQYLVKCRHCGKMKWILHTSIWNKSLKCKCQKKPILNHKAKHHNEIIGDWKLENTNKKAYNSRNTLYKYTCIHCGKVKYNQYSKTNVKQHCRCQMHK